MWRPRRRRHPSGARDQDGLSEFIKQPEVTVIVTEFVGPYSEQVRVVGEAVKPQAIPYRARMSVLDVMIAAGGLTQFAAGNRALIVRRVGNHRNNCLSNSTVCSRTVTFQPMFK
jgi:Periplasmic protein involved in polysaccharide export